MINKKTIFLLLMACSIIFSQDNQETFELKNGNILKGEKLSETSTTITLNTVFGEVTIDKDTILIKYYKVRLISGEVFMGNKVNETATEIFLDTEFGKISILKNNIREMTESNPDGSPLRDSIIESKKREFTKGEEVLTDLFLEPTANMLGKGSLYVSGLSFGFGVTDKLSITTKFLSFMIGNFNFRPKYQIFKSGNWEQQKALAVGFHYATRFSGGFPYNLGTWQEGTIEVPSYQGEYIDYNYLNGNLSDCDTDTNVNCSSGRAWEQTGDNESQTLYWGGYYSPGSEITIDDEYEYTPTNYVPDNNYDDCGDNCPEFNDNNGDGIWDADENAIFESGPYSRASINSDFEGLFSSGDQMLELFGVYTWSKAKEDKKGRVEQTIGANVKFLESPTETLVFPRLYYGLTTDINPKIKMMFMTFYDPNYIPAYKYFTEEVDYDNSYYFYSNSSNDDHYDCWECYNDDNFSTSKIQQEKLNPFHADFGFVYSITPTLRVSLHFQQPWIGFYWKL